MKKDVPQKSSLRVSVIIPTLNEATQLPQLLDALLAQTRPPDEIIVADAGSKDGTAELALARGGRVVPGGMPGPGRNAGARHAQGEIFLFLDADVLPQANFIEFTVDEFERSGYIVATCLMEPLSDDLSDRIVVEATNLYLQIISPVSPRAPGFCIFSRRSVHEAIGGFDETLKMCEDHDYARRASQHGEFGLLTSARIPVSMRRLEKEGLIGLAFKYLWCEMYALAGKPIRSMPFEYEFGAHRTTGQLTGASTSRYLVDIAELRAQLGRFENPIQSLSASGLKRLEQLTSLDWLTTPRERLSFQIEAREDAMILYRYLAQRLELLHRYPRLRSGWEKLKTLPSESIRLLEAYLPWTRRVNDFLSKESPLNATPPEESPSKGGEDGA